MAPVVQTLAGVNLLNVGVDDGFTYLHRALKMDSELPTAHHFLGIHLVNHSRSTRRCPTSKIRAGIFLDAGILALAFAKLGDSSASRPSRRSSTSSRRIGYSSTSPGLCWR